MHQSSCEQTAVTFNRFLYVNLKVSSLMPRHKCNHSKCKSNWFQAIPYNIFWKPMTKQKLLFKMHICKSNHAFQINIILYYKASLFSYTPLFIFLTCEKHWQCWYWVYSFFFLNYIYKYKPTVRTGPYFGSRVMKLPNLPLKLLFYLVRNISASPVWLHSGLYFIGQKGCCTTTTYLPLLCL